MAASLELRLKKIAGELSYIDDWPGMSVSRPGSVYIIPVVLTRRRVAGELRARRT